MIEHFDFIIYENFYRAVNHNKDVDIIARFLKTLNYKVAILNVCSLNNYKFWDGVPLLNTKHQFKPVDRDSSILHHRICNIIDDIKWNWHLHKVMKEIKGRYGNLYVGSYYTKMLPIWFYDVPKNANIYFWGLRSFWLHEYKYSHSIRGINSFFLNLLVKKYDNLRFFVSDENIKKEFIDLGVASHRLVLRYERYIDEIPPFITAHNNTRVLLSIGSFRQEKRIEKIVSALDKVNAPYKYVIAGKADDIYSKVITEAIEGKNHIERFNHRLTDKEFNDIFNSADYLVLCDQKPPSCVTNGTMNEALLKGKPIIAPNYEPYKSIVEKFHVGFLFDPDKEGSLNAAIESALKTAPASFEDSLKKYQATLTFDVVLEVFKKDLEYSLKRNGDEDGTN